MVLWKLLPCVFLVLLGALCLFEMRETAASGQGAEGASPVALPEALEIRLQEIRADPPLLLGRRVRFVLQFRERAAGFEPFLSRFGPADWTAFSGWADEVFTWDPDVYEDYLGRLFVRKGSALDEVIAQAHAHDRFAALGWVREVFLDEPWIEVESLTPLPESVGEGTILHVGRAQEFMKRGQWELALEQLERATAAPIPAHARAELERQIVECNRLLGERTKPRDKLPKR